MTAAATAPDVIDGLLTPEAVRTRAHEILQTGVEGALPHFRVDLTQLPEAASRVAGEIRRNYPDLVVPFHSRWRHFDLGGADLWEQAAARHNLTDAEHPAAEGDLAIVSVLLDAGAGADWTYSDAETGLVLGRSEGLALASLRLFESGALSADKDDPLRADAAALTSFTAGDLATAFQVTDGNPLVGLEERAGLLRNLGSAVDIHPALFRRNDTLRPGNIVPALAARGKLPARDILVAVLTGLMAIWPSPVRIDGRPLGDVGRHPAIRRADATDGIMPFHKLSQWLSYSLIEPVQKAGAMVTDLDGLTGLAEYRNGGLFVDCGVLALKNAADADTKHAPASELIVEWRALTVALLDRVADDVRAELGKSAGDLPLASILQGGTWSAGRQIAAERRDGGGPPIRIDSDATVF